MIASITAMIVAAALSICIFIIFNPRSAPVLSGQRWLMPGLGSILIVETLGTGATFGSTFGMYVNVRYRLEDGTCGYCTKGEIKSTGRLLPYQKKSSRDIYIEKILNAAKNKHDHAWKPYRPPPGWVRKHSEGVVIDAEIVNLDDHYPIIEYDKKGNLKNRPRRP